MRKIIKFCLDNNILVFDGVADSYNSLTKRLLYLSKKEYKKHFEGEPTFYFESGVSSERMNEIGISDYNTVDQKDSNWFFENDDYCKNRDEHMFVLSDGENGIVGCYS